MEKDRSNSKKQIKQRVIKAKHRGLFFLMSFLLLLAGGLIYYLTAYAPAGDASFSSSGTAGDNLYAADHDYGLVVVGSDPEGIAAAVSAARNGVEVLLLDSRERPGGLFTLGWLNTLDMNYDPDGNLLTQGIFEEFFRQIEGISFDVQTAEQVFSEMLAAEAKIELRLGVEVAAAEVIGGRVVSLLLDCGEEIRASRLIDATQDGDVAHLAGAAFTVGMEDLGTEGHQAVTLVLEVGGVDWPTVVKVLSSPGQDRAYSGAMGTTAWGYLEEMRDYQPLDPQIRSRGLNLGLQNNGNVLINAMHIFGVDGLDPSSRAAAKERGHREAEHLVQFMREQLPGFAGAYLVATAPELYVRETRHLQGLYRLTIDDVLEHRDFWDKVALASYPVDIQARSMHDWGDVIGNPAVYSIPLRCLVPRELDNLLLVGRAASYDSLAHGSARVVPVGMAAGEAAGVAAALSLEKGVDFHTISGERELVAALQERLRAQGVYLPVFFQASHALEGHPLYPLVKELRRWGLVKGAYDNDYRLHEEVELYDLSRVVEGYLERVLNGRYRPLYLSAARRPASIDDLLQVLTGIEGAALEAREIKSLLPEYGIEAGEPLLRGETFSLLFDLLENLD